jgi:formylglycine-generating enzyme required for sulfatase activity
MILEAAFIAALGQGLVKALEKLIEKGVIDPALEKGTLPLSRWITHWYENEETRKETRESLRKAVNAALDKALEDIPKSDIRRSRFTNKLTGLSEEKLGLIASAAVELTDPDPRLLSVEFIELLDWHKEELPALASFLFDLREELLDVKGYQNGILYANQMATKGYLKGFSKQVSIQLLLSMHRLSLEKAMLQDRGLTTDEEGAFREYLQLIRDSQSHIPLPLTKRIADAPQTAQLKQVFVPLHVYQSNGKDRQEEQREIEDRSAAQPNLEKDIEIRKSSGPGPLTFADLLPSRGRIVLLGKPGSGKTTLLRRLALALAEGNTRDVFDWDAPPLLPVFVRLRNFRAYQKSKEFSSTAPGALVSYFEYYFREEHRLLLPARFFDQRLKEGNCVVLLDGLDEVSEGRDEVAQSVDAFIRCYGPKGNRFVLASRPKGYESVEEQLRASQLDVFEVSPLTPEGVHQLIGNLFAIISTTRHEREANSEGLWHRIFEQGSQELQELAANPLFCTALVLVYRFRGADLPQRRVDVLQEIVDLLLGFWKALDDQLDERAALASEDGTGQVYRDLGEAVDIKKRRLRHLAYTMQEKGLVEIEKTLAETILGQYLADKEGLKGEEKVKTWAENFLINSHERSGLLVALEQDKHAFVHEGFREYLAADYLRNQSSKFVSTILEFITNPDWEQVILLAGAHAELAEDLPEELLKCILQQVQGVEPGTHPWVRHLVMAGKLTSDMGRKLPVPDRERVISVLKGASTDLQLAAPARAEIADTLDALYIPEDLHSFIPIPSSQSLQFYIAKYPVTNAQYQRFVEAKDSLDSKLWQGFPRFDEESQPMAVDWGEAGLDWLSELPSYRQKDASGRLYPEYWRDPRFGIARRGVPVVGVSWYEANAFCQWLKRHWQDPDLGYAADNPGIKIEEMDVRLPTELEWVAAAGGDEPAERFPWDKEKQVTEQVDEIVQHANVSESEINRTTPVWMYPQGASHPHRVMDMGGNVWEWQANYYDSGHDFLAWRGGSWNYSHSYARLSARVNSPPLISNSSRGFRVVVLPSRS